MLEFEKELLLLLSNKDKSHSEKYLHAFHYKKMSIMVSRKGNWIKDKLRLENGDFVEAQFPEIISASRSTDIPAFYCDWFFHRLNVGYSAWTNPFNGVKSYVAYRNTRFIVFWSKNPKPLLKHIPYLKQHNIGCYVQFSLNDYEAEGLEKKVPSLKTRIETFKELVAVLGKGGVVWRFDPLILTDDISINTLLTKVENIGDQLKGYTEKLVFSFADIAIYRKVKKNLDNAHIPYHEWTKEQMMEFAQRLVELNKRKGWNYQLATCGEAADFDGIEHNHCIDDALMIRRAHEDIQLMEFLKVKKYPMPQPNIFGEIETLPADAIILDNGMYATHGNNKDKGQREFCGCMKAKDIGQYNTCIHQCEYCYANDNKEVASQNYKSHKLHSNSESITGEDTPKRPSNAEVYIALGAKYFDSENTECDYDKAVHYYTLAAAKGHPIGQYYLAVACETGMGHPKDLRKAIDYYTKAAKQGNDLALSALKRLKVTNN